MGAATDQRPRAASGDPFAPGLLARLPRPPRRVALLRPSRLGDFLCATPAFRALRRALPEAEITLIGLPFAEALVARSTALDRFAAFPGFPGLAEQLFDARAALAFFARMQAERFDLAVQMVGSGVYSTPVALLLGAAATAGFVRPGDGARCLDAALPYPAELHEVRRLLALTTFIGAPSQGEALEFPLWPADHAAAGELLAAARPPFIGLHPSAMDASKRWPPERFAAAGAILQRRHGGTLVILASAADRCFAAATAAAAAGPCLDLSGRTSLPVLGGVIARLAVLITNDSGPAHIGYALGTPTVTVFGSTDPAIWGPLAGAQHRVLARPMPCRPCGPRLCPIDHACLKRVTVEEVVRAAEEVMRQR